MRSRSLAGLLAGSLLMAVSCSGDDDARASNATDPSAPTTAPTTTSSTTVEPTTTVELTTTTVESTTTTPEPSAPPATEVTTTTLPEGFPPRVTFPDDPEKQAVVDAAYAFYDAANSASRNPADQGWRDALVGTSRDPIRTRLLAFLDDLVARDQRVLGQAATRLDIYAMTLEISGESATFDACSVDADVRIQSGSDGDSVVDDSIASWNQTYQLIGDGDAWRVADIMRFAGFEGQLGCGAN